ncbi:hypothetical protein SERLA73DRAFT_188430, partial [Serpula lacrymans var. lacrymans S7.3]
MPPCSQSKCLSPLPEGLPTRSQSDDVTNDEAESQANALLQRVALVSGENVAESDLVEVVTEVDRWLATEPSDVYS